VKYLLDRGADPLQKNDRGLNIYHYLAQYPNPGIANVLKGVARPSWMPQQ